MKKVEIKYSDRKNIKYKQALDEVEKFISGACDACKEFTPNKQNDLTCRYCNYTQILNIINKAKEE